jgi:hypothetical protein
MLRTFRIQKRIRGLLMASLAALVAAGLATPVQAAAISFNPNPGTTSPSTILSLNFGSGNALAEGAISNATGSITPGSTFQLVYQTTLVAENGLTGPINPPGINGPVGTAGSFQITEVASITEIVSPLSTSSAAIFTTAPVQAAGSGLAIYYQNLSVSGTPSNNGTGAGFAVGTVILTAAITNEVSNYTDLTKTTPAQFPVTSLNSTGGGSATQQTDQGTGSTTLVGSVTFANSTFFPNNPQILLTSFSSNLVNPFKDILPSSSFANISVGSGGSVTVGTAITPSLGAINGTGNGPGGTGVSDFQLEVSGATQAFSVPEPSSITMAVTGIGMTFLAAFRARRRRGNGSTIA